MDLNILIIVKNEYGKFMEYINKTRGENMNKLLLDEMITYIENHLTEPINYKMLSLIVGLPPYILQRVFHFITNMTIKDYIRKRRLSKAYEDLLKGDYTITEIALTYGYSSNSSFCRAFKKHFDCLPKEIKRKNEGSAFPKILFNKNIIDENFFRYKIKKVESLILYGKRIEINEDYYASQIYQFYNDLEAEGFLKALKENIWYGATLIENGKEYYFVGSTKFFSALEKIEIKESKYLMIDNVSDKQNDIVNTEIKLHSSYLPSTNYIPYSSNLYELEIYKHGNCTIAIPIN